MMQRIVEWTTRSASDREAKPPQHLFIKTIAAIVSLLALIRYARESQYNIGLWL